MLERKWKDILANTLSRKEERRRKEGRKSTRELEEE